MNKILLGTLILITGLSALAENKSKIDNKNLFAFLEKQICTKVVTSPAKIGESLGRKSVEDFKDLKFDIVEWRQSRWGGRHQTKGNLVQMAKMNLDKLIYLNLGQCGVDDGDMKNIAKLKSLETLVLYGNKKITDKGLKELHALKSLVKLELDGIPLISEKAIKELRQALPECKIIL